MKTIIKNENLTIYIYKYEIKENLLEKQALENYIKKIIINIKKRYIKNINGFFTAKVYYNNKYGMILDIIKEDELDFFKDILDIKVSINYESDIFLSFEDYFLVKNKKIYYKDQNYYINNNDLEDKEILKLSEFSKIIYGEELKTIKTNLKHVL